MSNLDDPTTQRSPARVESTSPASVRQGLLILGMHRSGTSATAGVLGKLGCALPTDLMGPGVGNEKGHWESLGAMSINDRILDSGGSHWEDWNRFNPTWYDSLLYPAALRDVRAVLRESFGTAPLFVLKDPRICRLVPLWLDAFEAEAINPSILLCVRDPAEVALSLASRDGMEEGYAHLLWLRHTLESEAETRGRKRAICHFDQLRQDWFSLASRISNELGIVWPKQSASSRRDIEQFLAPAPYTRSFDNFHSTRGIMPWSQRVHDILKRWAERGEDRSDDAELDRILAQLDSAAEGFSSLILPGSRSLGAGCGHAMREALAQAEANLSAHLGAHHEAIREMEARLETALSFGAQATAALEERTRQLALVEGILGQREEEIARTYRERDEARDAVQDASARLEVMRAAGEAAQAEVVRGAGLLDDLERRLAAERVEKEQLQEIASIAKAEAELMTRQQEWLRQINAFLLSRSRWWVLMPEALRRRKEHAVLRQSSLFDARAYLELYPDVAADGVDPVWHYLVHGIVEGRRLTR